MLALHSPKNTRKPEGPFMLSRSKSGTIDQTWVIKKSLRHFLMNGVQLPQGYRATRENSLRFTNKSPGGPGIHLIDLGRMRG